MKSHQHRVYFIGKKFRHTLNAMTDLININDVLLSQLEPERRYVYIHQCFRNILMNYINAITSRTVIEMRVQNLFAQSLMWPIICVKCLLFNSD